MKEMTKKDKIIKAVCSMAMMFGMMSMLLLSAGAILLGYGMLTRYAGDDQVISIFSYVVITMGGLGLMTIPMGGLTLKTLMKYTGKKDED